MPQLFDSYTLKTMTLKNRVVMPPMCQYSVEAQDGIANDWHYVHYVSRAIGGTGLIIIEMTDVDPDGRITNHDLGLWDDAQIPALRRIVEACQAHGAKVAIQLAHAGRKAVDADVPVAPSAIPFDVGWKTPKALSTEEVAHIVEQFRQAARRAVEAGVDAIELHGAHGYLIHQFQSALTNRRNDRYGDDKSAFACDIIRATKAEMPEGMPLIMRISGKEYVEDGYTIDDCLEFSRHYQHAGVDMFHVSSGGEGPIGSGGRPGGHAGYQVPLARAVREALSVPVIAVGLLDDPIFANAVIGNEDADLVAVGRGMLRNPYWALDAARTLAQVTDIPVAYKRGF